MQVNVSSMNNDMHFNNLNDMSENLPKDLLLWSKVTTGMNNEYCKCIKMIMAAIKHGTFQM